MQQQLIAGDTLDFDVSVPDYAASAGYTLKYRLVPRAAGSAIEITASANGADYAVEVSAATTSTWAAGEYAWYSWVEITGARYTIDSGQITIKANPATLAAAEDTRSQAEIALAAINAVLANRATLDQEEYTIGQRSLKRTPVAELIRLKNYFEGVVAREGADLRAARGLPRNNKLLVRFR